VLVFVRSRALVYARDRTFVIAMLSCGTICLSFMDICVAG
jgi:hypothetical protein